MSEAIPAFRLEPQYRDYVWGGTRLRQGQTTAEVWVVHESDRITSGPLTGQTLDQVSATLGPRLLGLRPSERTGNRFPLLIKLLDCAQWLSLQVHPNDQQAVELEGQGQFGKTEAWHIIEAEPGAEILCGFRPDAAVNDIFRSVRDGTVLDYAQNLAMHPGDTVFIRAGTMHALGPGLLVYEVQQTSNITYRVFDWNRPASAGRQLHIEQSLVVLDPKATGRPLPQPPFVDGANQVLVDCEYFSLELLTCQKNHLISLPAGQTFHILTVIEGAARLFGDGWQLDLDRFDTALVPASVQRYEIHAIDRACLLRATA